MAYGVCSGEKHVYELKDGKKMQSALPGLGRAGCGRVEGTLQCIGLTQPKLSPSVSATDRSLGRYYANSDALRLFFPLLIEVNSF